MTLGGMLPSVVQVQEHCFEACVSYYQVFSLFFLAGPMPGVPT